MCTSLRQEFRLAKLQLRHLDEDWAATFGSGACDCLTPAAFLCLRAAELAAMLAILGVSIAVWGTITMKRVRRLPSPLSPTLPLPLCYLALLV